MESGQKRVSATARRAGIGGVVAALLLTSACAAGQRAETAEEKPTLDGTETNVGPMQLRGLALQAPVVHPYYPAGSDVAITVVMSNSGTSTDRLTGVSSAAFTSWSAFDSKAQAQAAQDAADPLAPVSSAPADTGAPSGTATGTAPASASASPVTPTGTQAVAIAPGSRVGYGTPEATGGLLVLKTKRPLYPGNAVEIRFSFAKAGSKTVSVPVQLTAGPNDSVITDPAGSASSEG